MAKEIELKYRPRGYMKPIWLFGHPTIVSNRKKIHIYDYETTYLDTPEGDAEKSGLTLRVRIENGESCIYAKKFNKAEGALSSRDEWRVRSDDIPHAARTLARCGAPTGHLIGKELIGKAKVSFKRMECLVFPKPGFSYMLSYDVGAFANTFCFEEIELELVEGTEAELIGAGEILAKDLSLEPEPKSKHARAIFYTNILYDGEKD